MIVVLCSFSSFWTKIKYLNIIVSEVFAISDAESSSVLFSRVRTAHLASILISDEISSSFLTDQNAHSVERDIAQSGALVGGPITKLVKTAECKKKKISK